MLDPDNPLQDATKGDNIRDNVEQVRANAGAAAGTYTITVSHKGTLAGGMQWYSLAVSGQSPASGIPPVLTLTACEPASGIIGSQVSMKLQGFAFLPGSHFFLRRAGYADLAVSETAGSGFWLEGELDLTGAELGSWDVVAVRPDGSQGCLPGAFHDSGNPHPQPLAHAFTDSVAYAFTDPFIHAFTDPFAHSHLRAANGLSKLLHGLFREPITRAMPPAWPRMTTSISSSKA